MSRSNPTTAANPATRFFEWSGEKGQLSYWDKATEQRIAVKMPFSFLVLDEVSQVGGGRKVNGVYDGYWSNAVKDLNTQIITVRNKQGIIDSGLYADKFKDRKGFHYIKGLYVAYKDDDGELSIGFIKFRGSALGAWFEFTKQHRNIYQGAFIIRGKSEPIQGEQGSYYTPVFGFKADISPESDERAKQLDIELQEYFKQYFANSPSDPVHSNGNGHADEPAFAGPRAASAAAGGDDIRSGSKYDLDAVPEDLEDDGSIPF